MFYYAIMAARHTVQYTHTHTVIHANTSTKTQKDFFKQLKTVKRNRTGKTRAALGHYFQEQVSFFLNCAFMVLLCSPAILLKTLLKFGIIHPLRRCHFVTHFFSGCKNAAVSRIIQSRFPTVKWNGMSANMSVFPVEQSALCMWFSLD